MFYSVHAWRSTEDDECFKSFPSDARDPRLALTNSLNLLQDNPGLTLVMVRLWFQVVRFDHELGAIQIFRIPGQSNITARVDRLINLLSHGTENRVYRPDVFVRDRKPVKVQLEFSSIDDALQHLDKLIPYMHDDPPSQIIVPA